MNNPHNYDQLLAHRGHLGGPYPPAHPQQQMQMHQPQPTHRRFVVVQIDGLSAEVLDCALLSGRMPFLRRLMARPVTTLCIDCKEEKEQEELNRSQTVGRSAADSEQLSDSIAMTKQMLEETSDTFAALDSHNRDIGNYELLLSNTGTGGAK